MLSKTGILRAEGISKSWPGTLALDHVDLEIRPGEVVALLGENGAGKSTLAKIVAGAIPPSSGQMTLGGEPFAPHSPAEAQDRGVALIHQETRLLPDLSIAENVTVGHWPRNGMVIDKAQMVKIASEKLALLGFSTPLETPVGDLSVAAQQQVEIAKALALDADIMVLDEPTTALANEEVDALFKVIESLKASGVGFVYVSHRLAEISRIADRIVVLRDGQLVTTHDSGQVPTDLLVSEMVGRSVERLFPEFAQPSSDVVLEVDSLSGDGEKFKDISFSVHAGEVFGLAGLVGAGRSEVLRAIAGVDGRAKGSVRVSGEEVPAASPRAAIDAGIAFVPEDRKAQGIILDDSIRENVLIPNLDILSKRGIIQDRRLTSASGEVIDEMGVKGMSSTLLSSLSGGNQQKVVIGRWLVRNPRVILLDEPTRGIDVGARAAIYEVIANLARDGMAVVVVSSDLDEVLGLSDRVMVLSRGEVRGVLDAGDANPERVMYLAATGGE